MYTARRPLLALAATALVIGSCVGGEDPTGVPFAEVGLALQPALIPSAANGDALPVNRIRTVVSRQPDGALLREQRVDVLPTAAAWTIDVNVPVTGDGVEVVVYIYLLNVAGDGTETVQFSGRTGPLTVSVGERIADVDADIVRGPLENLLVTGVTITSSPGTIYVGDTDDFAADITTSGPASEIFWTSLDPTVLTMLDSVGTGVSEGTAEVVASAGAFADTVSVVVVAPAPTGGATNTWTAQSGNWSSASNWSLERTPAAADTVRLPQGSGYTVTLDVSDTVATVVIGGSVTLSIDNNLGLVMTGSGDGPELDIQAGGVLEIANGTIAADGIANAGTLRSDGTAIVEADSVRNTGEWRSETGVVFVGLLTTPWFETDGLLFVDAGAGLSFVPMSDVHYRGGTVEGTGSVLLQRGATLMTHQDLVVDGPMLVVQGASVLDQDSENITIGPSSFLYLISNEADSAVVRAGALNVDGVVNSTGIQSRIRAPIFLSAAANLDVLSSGSPSSLITGSISNFGSIFLGGTDDVMFGPGADGIITNEATGFLETFSIAPSTVVIDGQLENYGQVEIDGATVLRRQDASGNPVSAEHFNASGATMELVGLSAASLHVALGGTNPVPAFTNAGKITVEAATTLSVENLTTPAGQVIALPTAVFEGEGTVDLTGAAAGMPILGGRNDGTIAPGSFGPGILSWFGTVPMGPNGVIEIEIDGQRTGTGFDQLNITSQLVLNGNGTLDMSGSTYSPFIGDRFAIVSYGARAGDFANVIFPAFGGVGFDTLTVTTQDPLVPDTLVVVVTDGPSPVAADWAFDDGQGQTAADLSGQGIDGMLGPTGTVELADPAWLRTGRVGQALSFSGSQVVSVPDNLALEPSTFTVEAFVRAPASPGPDRYIISKGGGPSTTTSASYGLHTGAAGGLVFYTSVNGSPVVHPSSYIDPGSIWDGQWHHVAATFDGFQVAIWVDGVQVGPAKAASIGYLTPQGALAIGALHPGDTTNGFIGDIDEVRVTRRVLTSAEIQARASR